MKNPNVLPESLLIPSSNITSDHTFELTMNQALSAFPDDSHLIYAPALTTSPSENAFPQGYPSQHQPNHQSNMYNLPTYTQYPGVYSQNDVTNHLAMFDTQSPQVDSQTGINWGQNQMFDPSRLQGDHRSKIPVESVSIISVMTTTRNINLRHRLVHILKTLSDMSISLNHAFSEMRCKTALILAGPSDYLELCINNYNPICSSITHTQPFHATD